MLLSIFTVSGINSCAYEVVNKLAQGARRMLWRLLVLSQSIRHRTGRAPPVVLAGQACRISIIALYSRPLTGWSKGRRSGCAPCCPRSALPPGNPER
ncbi:hypothetical protein MARHY2014 [Marinobacter nauticus ATCC 49840]|nr:hypothetical protein MARHY2014 [Marinobacter nauticus ATCC 49840]